MESPTVLLERIGESATGEWFLVDQDRIRAFADATEDWQWIHLDETRAAAGPFGTTIAHGYLTLSLLTRLTAGLLVVDSTAMAINYGLDRVRFLEPVPSGSRVRATTELTGATTTPQGIRASLTTTVEIAGRTRPALIADTVALFVPA
ncbi:MaoC family dehydratase [Microbacterium sp. MYb64]|uniref:MaoC family dehydratase n=1 Tax=Microbacterium sp. MYb64 TaxID=1848691 RepID=UPI00280A9AA8|nr:MaoC family dehydratase [Microbacterium sp. MYb64]